MWIRIWVRTWDQDKDEDKDQAMDSDVVQDELASEAHEVNVIQDTNYVDSNVWVRLCLGLGLELGLRYDLGYMDQDVIQGTWIRTGLKTWARV